MIKFRKALTAKTHLAAAVLSLALVLGVTAQPALSDEFASKPDRTLAYSSTASDEQILGEIKDFVEKKAVGADNLSATTLIAQLNQSLQIFGVSVKDLPSTTITTCLEKTRSNYETIMSRAYTKAVNMVKKGASQAEVDLFLTDSIKYGCALWGDSAAEYLMGNGAIDLIAQLALMAGNEELSQIGFSDEINKKVGAAAATYKPELSQVLTENIDLGLRPHGLSVANLSEPLQSQYLRETSPLFAMGFAKIVREATAQKKQGASDSAVDQFIYTSLQKLMQQWGASCAIDAFISGLGNEAK